MTNPYGPPVQRTSGARVGDDTSKPTQADSMPQGRGRGRQAAAFKPEQAGSGWIAPASSNDSETTQLKRAVSASPAVSRRSVPEDSLPTALTRPRPRRHPWQPATAINTRLSTSTESSLSRRRQSSRDQSIKKAQKPSS